MLRRKALKKIFITTLTAFIVLVVSVFPVKFNDKAINTSLEVEYLTGLGTDTIYLLNEDNYLVKSKIFLDSNDLVEKVRILLDNLIEKDNSNFLNGLYATIPNSVVVNDVKINDNIVSIDFSSDFLNVDKEKRKSMVSSIVYSVVELDKVDGVKISIEGKSLDNYPLVLDKNIGINERVNITSRNNIQKVVIYYLENIDNNIYYVPVTKYLNDDRDKINIIVEELTTSFIYEANLMSFLNSNAKLSSFSEKENIMFLNFTNLLSSSDDKILEEVKYSLAYSVFDNYDVSSVVFMEDDKLIDQVMKDDLKK